MKQVLTPADISRTLSLASAPYGSRVSMESPTYGSMEFVYAYSAGAVAKGDWKHVGIGGVAANNPAVVTPATTAVAQEAGVCCFALAAAGGVWVQTKGRCPFAKIDGTTDVAAGDALQLANGAVHAIKDGGTALTADTVAYAEVAETDAIGAGAQATALEHLVYILGRPATIG